jgi:hypothetical protein
MSTVLLEQKFPTQELRNVEAVTARSVRHMHESEYGAGQDKYAGRATPPPGVQPQRQSLTQSRCTPNDVNDAMLTVHQPMQVL